MKMSETDWVQPICLPTSAISARDLTGTRGWVAGWGATRESEWFHCRSITPVDWNHFGYGEDGRASSILKEVQVPLITNTACKSAYDGTPAQINTNVFCAGAKQGGRDSCQVRRTWRETTNASQKWSLTSSLGIGRLWWALHGWERRTLLCAGRCVVRYWMRSGRLPWSLFEQLGLHGMDQPTLSLRIAILFNRMTSAESKSLWIYSNIGHLI